jgi:tetrapyrrole methylase family protein/MazG family protein
MRAEKIQSKAAKAGFDWKEIGPALDKLSEEVEELKKAVAENSNVEEELGDVLFAAVKVGRFAGMDSELALHGTCEKFIRRFERVENAAPVPMKDMALEDLVALWEQAKRS